MSRFLIARELATNYGHLAHLLPIARRLRERSHGVVITVRDTHAGAELLLFDGLELIQVLACWQSAQVSRH